MRAITEAVHRLVGGEDAEDEIACWHGVAIPRTLGRAVGVTGRPR